MARTRKTTTIAILGATCLAAAGMALEPTITDWKFGNGAYGTSTTSQVNAQVSTMLADVLEVWYTSTNVYVKGNSIPSHSIGPFTNRNVYPTADLSTWVLKRTLTTPGGAGPALPEGTVAIFVNGVQIFTWSDGTSYEDEDTWHNIAVEVREDIDSNGGHPAPGGGGKSAAAEGHTHAWTTDAAHTHGSEKAPGYTAAGAYHYHTQSPGLRAQLGDDGSVHSPILGFAFDGYPIYGPYGYSNTDGTGGVRRMVSGYALRSIANRNTLADGTDLTGTGLEGPSINATYPLGTFAEDYEYTGGGDLDTYNGRFCETPEYPSGVYAYFATIDGSGNSAYPYTVGPDNFRGSPIMANMGPSGGNATIPVGATQYFSSVPVELDAFSVD